MEKNPLLPRQDLSCQPCRGEAWAAGKGPKRWPWVAAFAGFAAFKLFAVLLYFHLAPTTGPQSGIAWSTCPDLTEFECGYLSVPMRWDRPLSKETVSIALRKLPATAPPPLRKGSLLLNPGGPGGSGHAFVALFGRKLSVVVNGQYDLIGFDPRGVNLTTPPLDCYRTAAQQAFAGYSTSFGVPELPEESRVLSGSKNVSTLERAVMTKLDAWTTSRSDQCHRFGNLEMLKSVSTAFVARDMLAILNALGEEKLHYWGFSYGTILGATFSAMFPDRVGRVVLDGVSDSVSYTRNLYQWGWSGMTDSNKVFDALLSSCVQAGGKRCALAAHHDPPSSPVTAELLKSKYVDLYEKLVYEPLPFASDEHGSGIVTASTLAFATFRVLYRPADWPWWAEAVAEASKGDGAKLWHLVNFRVEDEVQRREWDGNVFHRHLDNAPLVATAAIMCGDDDREGLDMSLPAYTKYTRKLHGRSITGDAWALWLLECRKWSIKPYEAFRGPYDLAMHNVTTNFPVLWIGGVADPVTPLAAAKSMSEGFGEASARLLVHGGYGHCSVAQPSLCTALQVRKYLLDGELPENGTFCKANSDFLFPASKEERLSALLSGGRELPEAEEAELAEALIGLAEGSRASPGWLGL